MCGVYCYTSNNINDFISHKIGMVKANWTASKTADAKLRKKMGEIGKGTQFSKTNQPSPAAKSKWMKDSRDRRKEAIRIMNSILTKSNMKIDDFLNKYMDKKIKINFDTKEVIKEYYTPKKSLTIMEGYVVGYVYNALVEWWFDYMNRLVWFAPTKTELTGEDWDPIETTLNAEDIAKIENLLKNNFK